MTSSPITIVFTLLGGLILAGIVGWVRRARLIVLVPRLFTHSQLTSRGQLAEITIFNRGFKTEEAVELALNPNLQYEIVGSNNRDSTLDGAKLTVPRIGPSEEVTALLLIEGGQFSKGDIESCLSKESKGVVVGGLENVPPTGPQRIGLVAFLVVIPLAVYAMTYIFDYVYHTDSHLLPANDGNQPKGEKRSIEIQGWNVPSLYKTTSGSLFKDFVDQKLRVSLHTLVRKKDGVSVPVLVENLTSEAITYSLTVSGEVVSSDDGNKHGLFVLPGKRSDASVTVIVPKADKINPTHTVLVECFIKNTMGDSLSLTRLVTIN